jgi:hypothetical protein
MKNNFIMDGSQLQLKRVSTFLRPAAMDADVFISP